LMKQKSIIQVDDVKIKMIHPKQTEGKQG